MSLRVQLLVVALVVLLLPIAGWQSVRQMEGFLRSSQEDALIAAARATAAALAPDISDAARPGPGLYVRDIGYPPTLDGYGDDWDLWWPWAQSTADGRLAVVLARDAQYLYGLCRVRDDDVRYLDPRQGAGGADHLRLAVSTGDGTVDFHVATGAPGELETGATSGASAMRLRGAWQETTQGYVVEWRLPARRIDALGIAVHDAGAGQAAGFGPPGDAARPRPLVTTHPDLAARLGEALPEGARGWVLDGRGWVLARGGQLATSAARQEQGGRWWRSLVYRYLLAPSLSQPRARPLIAPRLQGSEVERAHRGEAAVRWQPAPQEQTVLSSVAVPVPGAWEGTGAVLVVEQSADALLVFTNDAVLRMVGLTMLAFVAAALALLAFASLLSYRIRRLRDAAERALGPDGRVLGGFPVPTARDELGDLGRSFASLIAELRGHTEYLRTLADKLAHELRTPLAMVRSSLDNLEQERLDTPASEYARRARQGTDRLAAILRAMSEASRVEESIRHAEVETFDPAKLVAAQVDAWRELHDDLEFRAVMPDSSAPMRGAPELVSRLLDKLLENAVDFTAPGGVIRVTLDRQADRWRLRVFNEGPPLPEGGGRRLFDSMVTGRRQRGEGVHLGLGLYIARLIAEFHRGAIVARNTGDGVEFEVWFVDLSR